MMKLLKSLIILPILIFTLVGCKEDDEASLPTLTSKSGFSITLPYSLGTKVALEFTASDSWTTSVANRARFNLSATSGKAGTNCILVQANRFNCTNEDLHYSFTINSTNENGTTSVDVDIAHEPIFRLDTLSYEAKPKGDTLHVKLRTKAYLQNSTALYAVYDDGFEVMWDKSTLPSNAKNMAQALGKKCMPVSATRADDSEKEFEFDFVIKPNTTSHVLTGSLWFCISDMMFSEAITVVQEPADAYSSQDMVTNDGKVTQLQKHKQGKGVPIVIMGDGFLDRDITSGKYREASNKALEGLFSLHPMKALRDYFDVYEVTAVSRNDYFTASSSTAFSSSFTTNSTRIDGDDDKAREYAEKAIGEDRIDDALIVVVINDPRYAGTCSMRIDPTKSDIPNGCSIAYVPLIDSKEEQMEFASVLCHEAIGHGFAKLADEYDDMELGRIPDDKKQELTRQQGYGCYRNVAFNSDVKKSYWADFAADSRYDSEHLGCYEGAATYAMGVYRPTDNSIMNDNTGGFNVAGRIVIYKRCMKIANGDSWKFNLADFIAFDIEEGRASASSKRKSAAKRSDKFVPLATPKVVYLDKR